MASTMNKAWWVKTKDATLADPGDSVQRALEVWDTSKAGDKFGKIAKALEDLSRKATTLKAAADKTKHKKTITLLESYIENCKEGTDNLARADGSGLAKNLATIPKAIMADLEKLDKIFWISYQDTLLFLQAMKSGKGSQKIYDDYIKPGAKRELNEEAVPRKSDYRLDVQTAVENEEWDAPAWTKLKAKVASWFKAQAPSAQAGCEKVEKLMLVEAMRNM